MSVESVDEVNIFELSYDELEEYNNQKYVEFKELYYTTNLTNEEIFHQLHINKGDPTYRYIKGKSRIDKLKRTNQEWKNTKHNTKTPLDIHKTPEEAYTEYKYLFYNTKLSIRDIYERIGVPQTQNTHYTYIREQADKEGLNGYRRRLLIKNGGRPKGVKNSENLTDEEKKIQTDYFEEMYHEFLEYYKDENLSVQDILKKMGTHHKSNMYFYFRRRLKEDGLDPTKRQGKIISKKVKETYTKRHEENMPAYEKKYQEYKRLFNETELSMKEIYLELDVEPRSVCAKHIRKRAKEEGLNAHKRRFQINPHHKVSPEEEKIREELYQEYKRLLIETELTIGDIYKKLGISSSSSRRAKYIRDRAIGEGLNGRTRMNKIRRKHHIVDFEEGEPLFQQYRKLFHTTDYRISEIYEKIGVVEKSPEFNYIRKRCSEEGLDGLKRMHNIKRNKKGKNGRKKYKSNKSKGQGRKKKYSPKTIKQVDDSSETLNRVFKQRNVQEGTQKGYVACMYHWFNFMGDKFNNLQEAIDFYISEEDKRIPMRDRKIKADLLAFREYLINCDTMNTKKSIMSYYSKITAIFRHFALEVPVLPQVKLEKGYVSNYNDLPTHDMIREACEQSNEVLKALFLFMSSSGSAKAETLSITVGMFLKGCSEYLDEVPTSSNIRECIYELIDRHDIIPLIYLRRIKTDKWYYTCCSPEASYMIIKYLSTCNNLKWDDQLFPFSSSLLLTRFQEINDKNNWGRVGGYRRFRAHALRKFMASNIGLPRDQVDSFQGRSKDMIAEAYFKQDPRELKKIYFSAMHRVMIYDNFGYEIPSNNSSIEINNNPATDNNHLIQEQPVKTEIQDNTHEENTIADELLKYATLMEKGLITENEFQQLKNKLLGGILNA